MRSEPRTPPIAVLTTATIAVVVAGGIYLSAYIPRQAPLGPAYALLAVAAVLLVATIVLLRRIPDFAWDRFVLVAKWALLGYAVEAGMLEYVFVFDHVRGGTLVVLTLMLVIFGVDIPLLLAYSVARHARRSAEAQRG